MFLVIVWSAMTTLGILAGFLYGCSWLYDHIDKTLAYIIFFGLPYTVVCVVIFNKWRKGR
jgi:hypothetical protein